MSKITYQIVLHDGALGLLVVETFSETFPTPHDAGPRCRRARRHAR